MDNSLQPHRGGLILAFGVLGWVLCFPLAIAAWVMGSSDLKAMDAGRMDPAGRGLTQAGKILGIVWVVLALLGVLVFVGMLFLGVGISAIEATQ